MEQMRERVARDLQSRHAGNHPVIHCNRMPSWDEVSHAEQYQWLATADAVISEIDRRVAEERAKLMAGLHSLELAGSAFAQLRSTIAVRFDGLTENSLWFALNKAFDDLADARAMLAQYEKEQQP